MNPRLVVLRGLLRAVLVAASLSLAVTAARAVDYYWDTNGAAAGSGNSGGTWDAGTNWSTSSAGTTGTIAWADGNQARFSAGTDGVGSLAITLSGAVAPAGVIVEEGMINLAPTVNINNTAGIRIQRGTGTTRLDLGGTGTTTATFVGVGNPLNIGGQTGTATLGVTGSHVLQVNGNFFLGERATHPGNMDQTGGTVNVTGQLRVAHWSNETSVYDISAGTLNSSGGLYVGWDGVGDMNVTGTANVSATGGTTIWRMESTIDGDATFSTNVFRVGDGPRGHGTLNIGGNATVSANNVSVGDDNGDPGTINQSGGTFTVSSHFRHGHWPNETSTYNMSGGTLTLTGTPSGGTEQAGILYLGIDGTGNFTQSGGDVSATGMRLDNRGNTSGTDTYTMTGGTLTLGSWGITANASTQINLGGGTVAASATWSSSRPMTLTGTGGDVTFDTNGNNITLSGVLSGGGGLIKTGTGTLALTSGSGNSYSGTSVVSQGTLLGSASGAFGSGQITLNDAGTGANDVSLLLQNSADVSNNIVVANQGTGTVVIGSDGPGAGANATAYSGTVTLNRATTFRSTVTDRVALDGQITGNVGTLTIDGGNRVTFLSTANNFNGDIVISGAGTRLQASVASAGETIPDGSRVNVGSGAFLQLAGTGGSTETIDALTGSGTVTRNVGGLQTLAVGSAGGSGTFSGQIQDGGGQVALTKIGTGTQTLSGSSSYTGATNVNAGILAAGSNNALGSASGATTVASNATLGFTGGITYSTAEPVSITGTGAVGTAGAIDNLAGTNSFNGPITLAADSTVGAGAGSLDLTSGIDNAGNELTLNPTGGSLTVSGPVSNSGNLVKTGGGTATLSGANTYAGITVVNDGTLNVLSTIGPADVTVNSGGTLAGSDALSSPTIAANVTVNSGGTLSVGDASLPADIATLTVTGVVDFSTGSFFQLEISDLGGNPGSNPGWDLLKVNGLVDLMDIAPGGITVSLRSVDPITQFPGEADGFDPTKASPSMLIVQGGTIDELFDLNSTPFTVDASGFTNPQNGRWTVFRIGNNLYLRYIPIPEPATLLIALLGIAGGLGLGWRRRMRVEGGE